VISVFLVTNGGSGEDGDEWHLKSIHATRQGAEADAADANKQCGFNEWEAEEWAVQGSPLTDDERDVLGRVANDASYRAMGWTEKVVRGLLERCTPDHTGAPRR
jgi:hypothetical protein